MIRTKFKLFSTLKYPICAKIILRPIDFIKLDLPAEFKP